MRGSVLAALGLAALTACSTAPQNAPPIQYLKIEYVVVDRPDLERLEQRYRNRTSHDVCISQDQWPNAAGKLNLMGDRVFLEIDGQRYFVEKFNTGSGFGDDGALHVKPGAEITGRLDYASFGVPASFRNTPKTLKLDPSAYVCFGKARLVLPWRR